MDLVFLSKPARRGSCSSLNQRTMTSLETGLSGRSQVLLRREMKCGEAGSEGGSGGRGRGGRATVGMTQHDGTLMPVERMKGVKVHEGTLQIRMHQLLLFFPTDHCYRLLPRKPHRWEWKRGQEGMFKREKRHFFPSRIAGQGTTVSIHEGRPSHTRSGRPRHPERPAISLPPRGGPCVK